MMYGVMRGTGAILKLCEQKDRPYIYCDHSFFWQHKGTPGDGRDETQFRMIYNNRFYRHVENPDSSRFERLNVKVKPWRDSNPGDKIVVVPISPFVADFINIDRERWIDGTIALIKQFTDRPIVLKPKAPPGDFDPDKSPFVDFIQDAHAVVVAESNAAIDAVVEGIPIFCSKDCPAAPVGNSNLRDIENPIKPSRERWLHNLACLQFSTEEIMSGAAHEMIEQWQIQH